MKSVGRRGEPLCSTQCCGFAGFLSAAFEKRDPLFGLTITHNFRELREQPKEQVGDNKKGAADNKL